MHSLAGAEVTATEPVLHVPVSARVPRLDQIVGKEDSVRVQQLLFADRSSSSW